MSTIKNRIIANRNQLRQEINEIYELYRQLPPNIDTMINSFLLNIASLNERINSLIRSTLISNDKKYDFIQDKIKLIETDINFAKQYLLILLQNGSLTTQIDTFLQTYINFCYKIISYYDRYLEELYENNYSSEEYISD